MSALGLVDLIHWLEEVFDRVGVRRSYGGALAYNYYGPPRLTQDVDVLLLASDLQLPALVEELVSGGCLYGDRNPRPLELPELLSDIRAKAHLVTVSCHGIRVEFFVPWHPFHHRVLERSPERDLEGRRIRIHAAEDLIVFKKVFDRPKDLTDIKAILMARTGKLDLSRIRRDAKGFLTDRSWRELDTMLDEFG